MPITVDTLGEIKKRSNLKFLLTFLECVVLSPSLYMLIDATSLFTHVRMSVNTVFCHYSPRFQRIIVNNSIRKTTTIIYIYFQLFVRSFLCYKFYQKHKIFHFEVIANFT